jgi:hypothetical protein
MRFVMTENRKKSGLVAVLIGAAVAGCGGNHPAAGTPNIVDRSFLFTTQPGVETHWCQYVKLPKTDDGGEVLLTGYRWTLSMTHHWSLYRTLPELPSDVDFDHPFDCFVPGALQYAANTALIIGRNDSGEQLFPPGTGYPLHSEEVLVVLAHTINASPTTQQATLDVGLEFAGSAANATPLGLMQFYDPYIVVPTQTDSVAQMRCRIPEDTTVFGATTHQHVRGTGVSAYLDDISGEQGTDPIVKSDDWEHPTVIESELHVPAGSYIRTVCQYHGDDHPLVVQGQDKLDNEMCIFEGFYYPAIPRESGGEAFENCFQTPLPGGVGDEFGSGSKSCSESLSCIRSCPSGQAPVIGEERVDVGACWQSCMVDSCPTASAPLDAFTYCVREQCASECIGGGAAGMDASDGAPDGGAPDGGAPDGGASCDACVVANCGEQYFACQAHHC